MNALSPPSPPNATHKANSNQCSADWPFQVKLLVWSQIGQLWFKTERLTQPPFIRVGGGAGGRRDDLVLTVVLHLEFDRTLSIHWRLEGRWWLWWHHSAVHCGLLGSDCVFKDDDYWAKSQWWERRTKEEENYRYLGQLELNYITKITKVSNLCTRVAEVCDSWDRRKEKENAPCRQLCMRHVPEFINLWRVS